MLGKIILLKEYHLKDFSIYSGSDVFDILLEKIIEQSYTQVFVLADENTAKHCIPVLNKYLFDIKLFTVGSGEKHKTLQNAERLWLFLQQHYADKKALLINLGGGMISDLGGFCAATYKRGIDYINIPTSLLSMVDAGIGGKTAIDLNGVKNAVGTIKQPVMIFINPEFLSTLPEHELLNGFAEIIKHGLIADTDYLNKITRTDLRDRTKLAQLINGSVKVKLQVIKKDPEEKSLRKVLNFGHTIGHALEAYSLANDKKPLKHGEAVAIGMVCEAFLSKAVLNLSNKELRQIGELIVSIFGKYSLRSILSPEIIRLIKQDKKNVADEINFTLLKRIGKASINHHCSEAQIMAALNYYDSL